MNHPAIRPARLLRSPVLIALSAALLTQCGCETIASVFFVGQSLYFSAINSISKDLLVNPDLIANAGADQLILTNESAILDGSASAFQLGSGTLDTNPMPPLGFSWRVSIFDIPDQNGDGELTDADLTAAGVQLVDADTAFPRFSSPVTGSFLLELTVDGVGRLGAPVTATDTAAINVFTPAP